MKRLIQRGLMFGNLFHVASPVLVDRYNRALEHLTGKRTGLTDFHIDISGYAPEIGHELGDDLYLNPNGVNRQFILLSTEQKRCPLLNAKFSTSRHILRHFIEDNEAALFALTARDAVAGELVNSVYRLKEPAQLLDIQAITVEADSTRGTVRIAKELEAKINHFLQDDDAWFDDVLIGEMIQLSSQTGDISRNPISLKSQEFEQKNFWTAHYGGLYIFRDVASPGNVSVAKTVDGLDTIPISDRNALARFLDENGLVEPIVKARGIDAGAVLRQKMDFILINAITASGNDLSGTTRRDLRRMARRHADLIPEEYDALWRLVNWAENSGKWPQISSEHPAYFYTLRAADHTDADLVNMLLAELTPKDVRQVFICHKELFYRLYTDWPEAKKEYVADYLAAEYAVDKAGARAQLFGREAPMEEPQDIIERVGPWGAVGR
ncbi:MAG: DUF6638 family protein [Pseudomonadota bacterium]